MSDTDNSMGPEPADNQGFIRLNWRDPANSDRPLLLFAPPESDVVPEFVEAIRSIGLAVDVWSLDVTTSPSARARVAELEKLLGASKAHGAGWVGVLPFGLTLARKAEKLFPTASLAILTDDPVVLWVGSEGVGGGLRQAMLRSGRVLAELSGFAASTRRDTIMISVRKAKEFPELVLRAFCEFRALSPDEEAFKKAATILGRLQSAAAREPVRRALVDGTVRGGVDYTQKNGWVAGWVKSAMNPAPLEVRVLVDGQEVARTLADEIRQDLAQAGIGNGRHGFNVDISAHLGADPVRVEVREVESDFIVGAIDMTIRRGKRVSPDAPLPRVAAE